MLISHRTFDWRFRRRRGTVLPLLAITLVALISFIALAVDVGMMVIAKSQTQNSADVAALTAARTLTGDSTANYNQSDASTNAQNILSYNAILGQSIQNSQLQISYGSFDYDQTAQTFSAHFPATSGKPTTAVTAVVTSSNTPGAFSTIFGSQFLPNFTATATAVHRPRDIALVMDLSGSMRMGTCLGFDFCTTTRNSNNPDTLIPTFGQYSSSNAALQGPSTNQTSSYDSYTISPSNSTVGNTSYSLTYVNSFYQNAAYASTLIRAFDSYTSADGGKTWTAPSSGATPQLPSASYASTPGGDVPLFKLNSATIYATNVNDVVGSTTTNALWELDGYSAYSGGKPDTSGSGSVPTVWTQADYSNAACQFNGYTRGPGYYGKTFFLWPPDPRAGAVTSTTALTNFLNLIGLTDATDQSTLSSNWSTWQSQGASGLTNLQNWLKGNSTHGGPYTPTSIFVPGSNGKAPIYYAVCRLFNRAYPAGASNGAFSADWRVRFFGTNNNTKLFNSSGSLNVPGSTTYTINYNAILSWLAQPPCPFPSQMRAGRIKYYGSIPTQITGNWPSYGGTDQQFWKEAIDYALGFRQTAGSTYQDISAMAGYGSGFTWGTTLISAPGGSATPYMNYSDNPLRPKLRHWIGPLAIVDYLQNFNMWTNVSGYNVMQPGDSYEAPVYTAKQAYLAAIDTMQTNHPNDWFSVICYSWPRSSASGAPGSSSFGVGRFNCVRSPLGPNYNYAQAALLFPFSTINADGSVNNTEVTPYDADAATGLIPSANFVDAPRADGETCFAMGLMLAYNQFATTSPSDTTLRSFVSSSPIAFPSGMAGGMGRKGAQKVIIFETDGLANTSATASLVSASGYKYYQIRYDMNNPGNSEFPAVSSYDINNSGVLSQINTLVQQLASDYSNSRNPFRLYAIGFGPVFQGTNANSALQTLQTMQYYAGTQSSASTPLPSSQIITGTDSQMFTKMSTTFTNILQSGVQIALIQ